MNVSSITTFFAKSTRSKNDATNKIRDALLEILSSPPKEFMEDAEHGEKWRIVQEAWNSALQKVATLTGIPTYSSIQVKKMAGRSYNYDAECKYFQDSELVGTRKLEFKFGGAKIDDLPQFLSLQANTKYFTESYAKFYYEKYLDSYIACDPEITEAKPSLDTYLKIVTSTSYSIHPLFKQLKERESVAKKEKARIVNASITDYLKTIGATVNCEEISEKFLGSQKDKYYLFWNPKTKTFALDYLTEDVMKNLSFDSIHKGNKIVLTSGTNFYNLLLRWRNHKGILNPAWQISLKRVASRPPSPALAQLKSEPKSEPELESMFASMSLTEQTTE